MQCHQAIRLLVILSFSESEDKMNLVGKVCRFLPFGGAGDIIVVKQHDGTFRSSPWYVRTFQGFLTRADEIVRIQVNGVEADFHMYLDNSGRAYFVHRSSAAEDSVTKVPTIDQIASLKLKEGQNTVSFIFSTRLHGSQKLEAHIYLWKWNTRIVICDVDGTITRSDVRGQILPLVGIDWTHSGIARLLSAINENGYQLLYLSARAIFQADSTKRFLFNLKQGGIILPNGPVVISPDGLFRSLFREVRKAPHEFKIPSLKDIKAIFPSDYNPFYAGFGNKDTDEFSYLKIGIPNDKIFIINPKGEVTIKDRTNVESYISLHLSVNDMFPPCFFEYR